MTYEIGTVDVSILGHLFLFGMKQSVLVHTGGSKDTRLTLSSRDISEIDHHVDWRTGIRLEWSGSSQVELAFM